MNRQTLFLSAMRRERGGYVPLDMQLSPYQAERLAARMGHVSVADYIDAPMERVSAHHIGDVTKFHAYHRPENLQAMYITCWGVGLKRGSLHHFTEKVHSMTDLRTLADFERYPLPDADADFDWARFRQDVEAIHGKGRVACFDCSQTIFEMAWQMRGMDALLMDMLEKPERSQCLFERMTAVRKRMIEQALAAGCEMLLVGDDVATQRGMLMRPGLWRETLKPCMVEILAQARALRPDLLIAYHGCGNMSEILDDIVEIGVDVLNPVQPECMEPAVVYQKYGDRLALWGLIGTQSLLPFGTPQQVYDTCMMYMETLAQGGGLMLAPAHVVEPEIPWENIEAVVRAVADFNSPNA